MLEKLFSRGAVAAAMEGVSGELTRAQAAMILDKLLESPNAEQSPYFPDVSPDMDCYEAVEHLGIQGSISWVKGERAEPGFVNLEGYLYRVGEDGLNIGIQNPDHIQTYWDEKASRMLVTIARILQFTMPTCFGSRSPQVSC